MDKVPNLIAQAELEQRIFSLRGHQVMIDRDLAALYDVETRALNQAVKRNLERFPTAFRFQLTEDEKSELITNCDQFEPLKHASAWPHAFTEQGVAIYDEGENKSRATIRKSRIVQTEDKRKYKRLQKRLG